MGIFDRFKTGGQPEPQTYEGRPVEPSEDEQALARYRYMLRTAPPEAIEQVHAEAFAKLTPEQRRMLLEQLRNEVPERERAYATEDPQSLARLATRAEVRQPGTMERTFGSIPSAAPGFGGMMASSLLGSVAGTVLGSMIAHHFLAGHGGGLGLGDFGQGQTGDTGHHAVDTSADALDTGRDATDLSDFGSPGDLGTDFDSGTFDV